MKDDIFEQRFAPVVVTLEEIMRKESDIIVGIDGRCGSGKSTLGEYLKQRYAANLFHMDDFFLRPEQRTVERMQEIGGNVDYERFAAEVLEPLKRRESVCYQRYDCAIQQLAPVVEMPYRHINIIEGSYSMHPYFGQPYQLKIFLTIEPQIQREVIRRRNGEAMLQRFVQEWIPKEEAYFLKYNIEKEAMLINYTSFLP